MSDSKIRILLIEDDEEDYLLARDMLSDIEGQPFELDWTPSYDKGREAMELNEHSVILLDYRIGERTGLEFLHEAVAAGCRVPIILMTGQGDRELDLQAMAAGAADYLVKGAIDSALLERSIRYALEKSRAEEALAAEKEHLAATLRSIGDGVIAADTFGSVLTMNEVAEQLTGWTQAEAQSRELSEIFQIVDESTRKPGFDPLASGLSDDASGDRSEPEEQILISRNKAERVVSIVASPMRARSGKHIGTVVAFRDISKRRQLEENLFRAQKMESIGLLAGGIAHDFNNFLMAMLGNISLGRMCAAPGEPVHDRLVAAEQAVWEARQLTEKLIAFSRGGGGKRATVDTGSLIREASELALRGSMARCKFSQPDDLWPVEVDEGQMTQVINNIVINADQAMSSNGLIQIRMENVAAGSDPSIPFKSGRYVRIQIEDEGEGIAPELLDRIFDPYYTTRLGAAGLGLATSFAIVANHDGCLSASSRLYSGAVLTILLPASDKPVESQSDVQESFASGSGRILLMDEERVGDIAARILSFLGYEVETANHGAEAVEVFNRARERGAPFDAVILAQTLPGAMGGKETMQRLLQSDPRIKGIVTTADASDPILGQFQQFGFRGALNKPFRIEELSQILCETLGEI